MTYKFKDGNEPKTLKQKINEPILNTKQVIVFCIVVIYEVISNILPLAYGVPINWIYVLVNIGIGILAFAVTMMLRAAYPLEMPDTSFIGIFKQFFRQIIDAVSDAKDIDAGGDLKHILERMMTWSVREWDVIYQKELQESIDYYHKKYPDPIEAAKEFVEDIVELTPEAELEDLITKLNIVIPKVDPVKAKLIKLKLAEAKEAQKN